MSWRESPTSGKPSQAKMCSIRVVSQGPALHVTLRSLVAIQIPISVAVVAGTLIAAAAAPPSVVPRRPHDLRAGARCLPSTIVLVPLAPPQEFIEALLGRSESLPEVSDLSPATFARVFLLHRAACSSFIGSKGGRRCWDGVTAATPELPVPVGLESPAVGLGTAATAPPFVVPRRPHHTSIAGCATAVPVRLLNAHCCRASLADHAQLSCTPILVFDQAWWFCTGLGREPCWRRCGWWRRRRRI